MKLPNFHANQAPACHPLSGGRKNKFLPTASAIALALLLPGIASAALVINVQYGPNNDADGHSASASMAGLYAGPSSDTGTTWNSFLGTGYSQNSYYGAQASNAALVSSTGSATAVKLSFFAAEGNAIPGSGALPIFRSGVFNNTANPINFVVSGLSPNKLYDFYAISGGSPSGTYAGKFHVTGAVTSASQTGATPGSFTAFNSGNALLFSGVAPTAGGLLTLTLEGGSYRTSNGFQLVELTAIPEPGSLLALGCLVGSGAFLRNRRRTK
jgi:hypothetical protein